MICFHFHDETCYPLEQLCKFLECHLGGNCYFHLFNSNIINDKVSSIAFLANFLIGYAHKKSESIQGFVHLLSLVWTLVIFYPPNDELTQILKSFQIYASIYHQLLLKALNRMLLHERVLVFIMLPFQNKIFFIHGFAK